SQEVASPIPDPKEGITVTAGPSTIMKLNEATGGDPKKIPAAGVPEDDGAYENIKSKSIQSLNKVLQDTDKNKNEKENVKE
ncbi:hypothetical protein PFISCL1PPCAC_24225, partial [Pristionchus fissidentatus]